MAQPETTAMESNPPGVAGNDCRSCAGFDAVVAQYPNNPTIRNMVAKWREEHADWDNCPNPRREVPHVPHNPNRAQSGMFDSHGDGHPPREHYMPAHTDCEPAVPVEQSADDLPAAQGEEVAE